MYMFKTTMLKDIQSSFEPPNISRVGYRNESKTKKKQIPLFITTATTTTTTTVNQQQTNILMVCKNIICKQISTFLCRAYAMPRFRNGTVSNPYV